MTTKLEVLRFLESDIWESGDWWIDIEDDVISMACHVLDKSRRAVIDVIKLEMYEDTIDAEENDLSGEAD